MNWMDALEQHIIDELPSGIYSYGINLSRISGLSRPQGPATIRSWACSKA